MCFELMKEMPWSWREYEETPIYVRQFCWDFIMRKRRIQNRRAQDGGSTPGVIRVKR